jgi:hypothetical protein
MLRINSRPTKMESVIRALILYVQLISLRYTISTMYRSYPCVGFNTAINTSGYTRLSNVVHDSYSSLIILLLPYIIASNIKALVTFPSAPLRSEVKIHSTVIQKGKGN